MDGRCRASEVIDLINFYIKRKAHVMAHEFEARMIVKMIDITFAAGEQVVSAKDFVPIGQKPINEMRTEKTCAPGHEYAFAARILARHIDHRPFK